MLNDIYEISHCDGFAAGDYVIVGVGRASAGLAAKQALELGVVLCCGWLVVAVVHA